MRLLGVEYHCLGCNVGALVSKRRKAIPNTGDPKAHEEAGAESSSAVGSDRDVSAKTVFGAVT